MIMHSLSDNLWLWCFIAYAHAGDRSRTSIDKRATFHLDPRANQPEYGDRARVRDTANLIWSFNSQNTNAKIRCHNRGVGS